MSYFMSEGMSEQPKVAVMLIGPTRQIVTYENPMSANTQAQNILARKIDEIKTIKRRFVRVVRYQENSRRFLSDKRFEPVVADNG